MSGNESTPKKRRQKFHQMDKGQLSLAECDEEAKSLLLQCDPNSQG
jgi:hypothetical protein